MPPFSSATVPQTCPSCTRDRVQTPAGALRAYPRLGSPWGVRSKVERGSVEAVCTFCYAVRRTSGRWEYLVDPLERARELARVSGNPEKGRAYWLAELTEGRRD